MVHTHSQVLGGGDMVLECKIFHSFVCKHSSGSAAPGRSEFSSSPAL